MKIALGFWGLTRSLKYTHESIQTNILDVLKNNNIDYTIFMHTYCVDKLYSNPRAGEKNIKLDNNEYKLLNADIIQIDNQDEIKKVLNLEKYRTQRDPWNTSYKTVDNFILATYSKDCLCNMIRDTKIEYDYIIFLRPDVKFINKIKIEWLKIVSDNVICIPNFHLFAANRFNDRFAITNMNNYLLYGSLFNKLHNYSKKKPLHAETYVATMLKNNKIEWITIRFFFMRTRAGGNIDKRDAGFVKHKDKDKTKAKDKDIIN